MGKHIKTHIILYICIQIKRTYLKTLLAYFFINIIVI